MKTRAKTEAIRKEAAMSPTTHVVLLVAAAAALSFFIWMHQSLRLDEAQSVWQTSRSLGGVFDVIAKDVHVPLYFVGLHFWEILFGTTEPALRMFSLVFFLFSIPAAFILARDAYSPRVAYATALLVAVSPFLNWYGSEARMYSMMFLFTILSHLYFMRLWKKPSPWAWAGYTAATLLGLFTHLFFLFVLAVQAIFFVWKKRIFPRGSVNRLVGVAIAAGALALAWFVYRYFAGAGLQNPLLSQPSSVDLFNVFSNFFIGFQTDRVNTFYLSLWPILVFVGFTFLSKKHDRSNETTYFMLASFVPIVLAFIVSATFQPIFLSRYLIIALPSLYILAVYFLSSYKSFASDIAIGAIVVVMLSMLVVEAIQPAAPVKEDFRDASAYVASSATPNDLFVVAAPFITYPVEYYYDGAARLATFPRWDRYAKDAVPQPFAAADLAKSAADWASVYGKVYILLGYDQGYNDQIRLYMDKHYQRLDLQTFSPNLTLYVYKLRYP